MVGGFSNRKCNTESLPIFGFDPAADWSNPLHCYGTEASKILALDNNGNKSLSKKFYLTKNQIYWAIKKEMAITLEDVLARRTRSLFLDAYETELLAPKVAKIMAEVLKKDKFWINVELEKFRSIIKNYKL